MGSHAVAVDAGGNAYVTGTARDSWGNGQLLTIKYGAGGVVQWRAFADGDQPGNGSSAAVAIDGSGNVYVAGIGGYGDVERKVGFITIKYDQNGAQLWRVLDTEPDNAYADAVTADVGGNVLITGHVFKSLAGGAYRLDYLTIRYDALGTELWRATVSDASALNNTYVTSLATDANGNSYLARMTDSSGKVGFLAVSYDANGNERWRVAPKASQTSEDYLNGATVDASGNVYLTGTSLDGTSVGGTSLRAFTVKYDSSGAEKWRSLSATTSETSNAVSIDGSSNVYTTGTFQAGGNLSNAVATKYDANGVQQWHTSTFGAANQLLHPYAVDVDPTGSVYVAGIAVNGTDYDYWTIKYGASGIEQWRKTASGGPSRTDYAYALKVDAAGNTYVTGSSALGGNQDWLTIKYNTAGTEQWRANEGVVWTDTVIGSGSPWSWRHAMAADILGNVYVTGYVEPVDFRDGVDFLTVKFDANGNELWRESPGSTAQGHLSHALAADINGSVYVTGTAGAGNERGYLTIKYGSSGQELWRAVSQKGAGTTDDPTAVGVDAYHNVYVTGTSYAGTTVPVSYFTVKYDVNGAEQWRQSTSGPLDGNYVANAVAVHPAGYVYVSGYGSGSAGTDCLTIGYAPAGAELWRATCNDQTTVYTDIRAIALDFVGNVYVAGSTFGASGFAFVTIKYSWNGAMQWRAVGERGGLGSSYGLDLAVDGPGNAYVVGTSDNGFGYDYLTIKYDPTGVEQWRAYVASAIDFYAAPTAVAVDGSGNVYVTGAIRDAEGLSYVTVKYDPDGAELWRTFSDNPARSEYAVSLALGPGNSVYLAGRSFGPTAPQYMLVQKLVEGVLPTTSTIASAQNPSVAGQSVAFSVTISGSLPEYLPKGTVNFADGTTPIAGCSAVIVTAQQASCNAVLAAAGMHSIAATYSGDNNNAPSASPLLSQRVLPVTTTILVSSLNPSTVGVEITFTASVTGGKLTGTVDFRDGTTAICVGVVLNATKSGSIKATCSTSGLTTGSHAIVASYSGDANNAGSMSAPLAQIVSAVPEGITLGSSPNPSTVGRSVTFTASVTGGAPTGTVDFRDGSSALCTAVTLQGGGNSPTAICATAALTVGKHAITAIYSGDGSNLPLTSSVLTQTVKTKK